MGVPGLWRELAEYAADTTLADLAWAHWDRTSKLFRLGIDATSWLYHARKSRGGAEPELRLVFYRLVRLLALPIAPVFVLDGAKRPAIKRGAPVWLGSHPLEAPFQALVRACGFAHWRAPGEAEAELAWLSANGGLDAVLTDDVDALLFGASVVLRPRASSADAPPDTVTMFDTRHTSWPYDTDALVLVALLAGGDYDVRGCDACGIRTAMALARSGSGAALGAQFRHYFLPTSTQAQLDASCKAWDAYIVEWRRSIAHELQTNEHGHLTRKQPALAAKLRASAFMGTARARRWLFDYVWPCTSQRTSQRPALERLVSQSVTVSLYTLAREAKSLFAWSPCTVLTRFERTVWPGVYVRRLLASAHTRSAPSTLDAMSGPRRSSTLLSVHSRRRVGQRDEARVSYDGQPFVSEVCRAVCLNEPRKPKACRCWVPNALLRAQQQDQAHVQACLLAIPRPSTPPPTLTACLEQCRQKERRSPTPLCTSDDSDVQFIEARMREVIVLSDESYST